jgi:hypothetical protein
MRRATWEQALYQPSERLTHRPQYPLIPAKAGTPGFFVSATAMLSRRQTSPLRAISTGDFPAADRFEKAWIPAFAGMSGIRANLNGDWY